MTLDEFAELFPVFVTHVDEFHAAPVWADIADHGGEIDLAKSDADLQLDRKSTRLNSSHSQISYAVFCLKKKSSRHSATWASVGNRAGSRSATSISPAT